MFFAAVTVTLVKCNSKFERLEGAHSSASLLPGINTLSTFRELEDSIASLPAEKKPPSGDSLFRFVSGAVSLPKIVGVVVKQRRPCNRHRERK